MHEKSSRRQLESTTHCSIMLRSHEATGGELERKKKIHYSNLACAIFSTVLNPINAPLAVLAENNMHVYWSVLVGADFRGGVRGGRKEGNVLFNDAFEPFYLRLYGVRHNIW